jgi:uncharacterized phage protein gp47/JayE
VAEVVSVYGSRGGKPHRFRAEKDYVLKNGQSLVWIDSSEGGEPPDDGTLVSVNYYPEAAQPVLTDIRTGSVLRTLCETVALEIARVHAQLEAVYQASFINTATGSALDKVVALLGIERIRAGRAAGEVELTRAPGSRGVIHLPAGTRIMTADGAVEYETTAAVTMADGQKSIRVMARDLETNDPLIAGALTVLPVPIAGIVGVTNPGPTALTTRKESDSELRQRAKSFLHGSERATLGALSEAIARQGVKAEITEVKGKPGWVELTPHAEKLPPEQRQRLMTAIRQVRPAGVVVEDKKAQAPRKVSLDLLLTTSQELPEQDLRSAHQSVRSAVADYFARLPVTEAGSVNRLVSLVMNVAGIEDVRLLTATWRVADKEESVLKLDAGELAIAGFPTTLGNLSITDPNLPTMVDAIITYSSGSTVPEVSTLEKALADALTAVNARNASLIPAGASRKLGYSELLAATSAIGTAPDKASFILSLTNGLTQELSATGDEYDLTSFERFSLKEVAVTESGS